MEGRRGTARKENGVRWEEKHINGSGKLVKILTESKFIFKKWCLIITFTAMKLMQKESGCKGPHQDILELTQLPLIKAVK